MPKGFHQLYGRDSVPGLDYDPDGDFCQDDYEFFNDLGPYDPEVQDKMSETYTQVILSKGPLQMMAWIPSEFAVLGEILTLRDGEVRNPGWTVSKTYISFSRSLLESKNVVLHECDKVFREE